MDLAGMPGPRRLRGLIFLVFWVPAAMGWTQPAGSAELTYGKSQILWGVLPLEDRGLEPALKPLASDLMIRLAAGWKTLPDREFTVEDLIRFQKEALDTKLKLEEKALADALAARDALLFVRGGATREEYALAEEKILQARANLEKWRKTDPQTLAGPVSAPLKQLKEGEDRALLLPPTGSFTSWMKSKSLDLAVGGWIRSVRGYLEAEILVWDPARKAFAQWTGWFSPDEAEVRLGQIRSELTSGLLGRQTASLTVRTTPPGARIFIDGEMKGVGLVELPYWEPGDYILKMEGEGLVSRGETVTLGRGEVKILDRTLEVLETRVVSLRSDPPGADVYVDSLWLGSTPLEIPLSPGRSLALFFLKGYEEGSLTLTGPGEGDVSVPMEPLGAKRSIRDAKDRFYLSLGIFSFSFASTALLRAMEGPFNQLYVKAYDAYSQGSIEVGKLNEYYTLRQFSVNGGTAGTILTSVLFAWVLWELNGFIASGESAQYK